MHSLADENMTSQMNLFVKLGSNRELTKLELSEMLERSDLDSLEFLEWKDYLFLSMNKNAEKKLYNHLDNSGSIIKVGDIFYEGHISDETNLRKKIKHNLTRAIHEKLGRKIKISINIQSQNIEERKKMSRIIRSEIRQITKPKGIDAKVIPTKKDSMELSSYQYHKENIPKRGYEINCFLVKSKILLGLSKWVTNPFKDIKQDEERPMRFFTHGTSIKLARTLINLSNALANEILLDPFCGTGTILLEALKQGINVIGVDKDPKCVHAAKANLNHFTSLYPSKKRIKDKWSIYHHDSRNLNSVLSKNIDVLVTEPYLGPFLKKLPSKEQGKKTMRELEDLYIRVLNGSKKHLKENGRILLIIPEYQYSQSDALYPDYNRISEKTSLKIVSHSKYFNVKIPVNIGRKHNIINRKLLILSK